MKTTYKCAIVFDGVTYVVEVIVERVHNELRISFGTVKRATLFGDPLPDPKLN